MDVLPRDLPEILPCKEESIGVFSKEGERSDGMTSKFPFPENVHQQGGFCYSEDATLQCTGPPLSPLKRSALATYIRAILWLA